MAWSLGVKGIRALVKKYGPGVVDDLKKAGHISADMAKEAGRVVSKDAQAVGKAVQKSKAAKAVKSSATGRAATKASKAVKKSGIVKKVTQVEHDIEKAAKAARKTWRGTKSGATKPKKAKPTVKPSKKTAAQQAKDLENKPKKKTKWNFAKGGIVKTNSNKADGWL